MMEMLIIVKAFFKYGRILAKQEIKVVKYGGSALQNSYFPQNCLPDEQETAKSLFHTGLGHHGSDLGDHHALLPAGMGFHLLVGQAPIGCPHDGNLLGLALPVPDPLLETPPGRQGKDPLEAARDPGG